MRKMSVTHHLRSAAVCVCAATAIACASSDGSRGYLAVIGPSALRFRAAPVVANAFVQLPLPEPAKAASVPASPSSEQTEGADPFALSEILAPAADRDDHVMEASSPPPTPTAVAPPEAPPITVIPQPITPRDFLPYFRSSATNAAPANPGAPVDFTPPRPTPSR